MAESVLRNARVRTVDTIDDAMELKRWLGERRETPLGLDTESGGLDPWRDRLRLIQVGDLHTGWVLPWPHWGGVALEILNAYEGEWVAHNSSYDAKVLEVHTGWKIPWHRTHDTMTLAGLDDPLRERGLKGLGARIVDPLAATAQRVMEDAMRQQGWTWDTIPLEYEPYRIYSAYDPVITCHMWQYLHPRVAAKCPDVYDLERVILRIVTSMMVHGMQLDLPYVEEKRAELMQFEREALAYLKQVHGVSSVNSSAQLAAAFARYGEELTERTDNGQAKMDKDVLGAVAAGARTPEARELARYALDVRHAHKLVGTYLGNFAQMADAHGVLHCSINPMAARTSRMSSSEPNLQNLPRNDKMVRGAFVPRSGKAFITCDLAQVEARLAGSFSGDPGIIQAFQAADNGGKDFFCGIGEQIFKEEIIKEDSRRNLVKNVVYGFLFSAGPPKMAQTAGVPLSVMQPVVNAFNTTYPGLRRAAQGTLAEARRNGLVVTLDSGRQIPLIQGREGTQAFNTRIQGTAAEYFKKCMAEIDAAGLGDYLRLVIHDECLLEVPREDAEEILHTVEECMTDRTSYRIPLLADGKVLPGRWAK